MQRNRAIIIARRLIRTRYAETDQMGFIYHSQFFAYFEIGRCELVRDFGFPYAELEAHGILMPLRECGAQFHLAARYDDLLAIGTRVEGADRRAHPLRLRGPPHQRRHGDASRDRIHGSSLHRPQREADARESTTRNLAASRPGSALEAFPAIDPEALARRHAYRDFAAACICCRRRCHRRPSAGHSWRGRLRPARSVTSLVTIPRRRSHSAPVIDRHRVRARAIDDKGREVREGVGFRRDARRSGRRFDGCRCRRCRRRQRIRIRRRDGDRLCRGGLRSQRTLDRLQGVSSARWWSARQPQPASRRPPLSVNPS